MRKKKKGQAAIEFLTTYSWAIMGILLTIGALSYFDIFNTSRFISERCDTGAQIKCVEAAYDDAGNFHMRLTNNYPVNVTITRIEIQQGNLVTSSGSINNIISRGSTETLTVTGLSSMPISNRESFDITITFRRTDGSNTYDIQGSAVVRQIPAGMI
jgi:type II secretory pathway pseudopilin PulG